ncbi:MAG: hypothetical protein GXP62_05145 [Oligoflexia bacterium]|nr:hypothetical protein [Oligoflexia bacterium]
MPRWLLLLPPCLGACATQPSADPRVDQLVQRVDTLEQRTDTLDIGTLEVANADLDLRSARTEAKTEATLAAISTVGPQSAAASPDLALAIRGLGLRVQDLEGRLADAAASSGTPTPASPELAGLPRMEVSPESGVLHPVLDEDATVSCAVRMISGIRTSELAYDAAFDAFSESLEEIGWAPGLGDGCTAYVAAAAELEGTGRANEFKATAVITRGAGRGRSFQATRSSGVRESTRLDETGIATFLAGHQWAGSPR